MRSLLALFALFAIIVVCNAAPANVQSLISNFMANQPSDVQSAIGSQLSALATITATDSSALASLSSQLASAASSALSDLSSLTSVSATIELPSTTIQINAAPATSNSVFAVAAAFVLSVVLFQAF
jgi:hypothetical protein